MAHKSFREIDTLGDRKDLWYMLSKLSPKGRLKMLTWACKSSPQKRLMPVAMQGDYKPKMDAAYRNDDNDDRLTNEIYGDMLILATNYAVDLNRVRLEIERRLRDKRYED